MNLRSLSKLLVIVFFSSSLFSQNLLDEIEDDTSIERVSASFKNSRVINAQSIETLSEGVLDYRISHRFGAINGGGYNFFGLDQAFMRMALEYGITDRFSVSIGRSGFEKTYDGSFKYRMLWQTLGSEKMPISLVLYSSFSYNSLRYNNLPYERTFTTRLNYVHQLIVARKFNNSFTLQLMPTLVHRNFVDTRAEQNTVLGTAAAARVKLTNRLALNAEYFYVFSNQLRPQFTNPLSIGFDIETGGHVFQLHFTNSPYMVDKAFISETQGNWLNGDIHFGFNISRVFTIKQKN